MIRELAGGKLRRKCNPLTLCRLDHTGKCYSDYDCYYDLQCDAEDNKCKGRLNLIYRICPTTLVEIFM